MSKNQPVSGRNQRALPEGFRARTLSVSLTVKDLDKSLAWYRDVIGFNVAQKHERAGAVRAVSLRAGFVQLLIAQDDGAKGLGRAKGIGFSFMVTTAQNVDELAQRIKERGGTLEAEPADMWGSRVFRVQDPDGFKMVISSER